MMWVRDNSDLIAVAILALALTVKVPLQRVHTDVFGHEAALAAEIEQALEETTGEVHRTLRTSTALHRYNGWTLRTCAKTKAGQLVRR